MNGGFRLPLHRRTMPIYLYIKIYSYYYTTTNTTIVLLLGRRPWGELSADEVYQHLAEGNRLPLHRKTMPKYLYQLMQVVLYVSFSYCLKQGFRYGSSQISNFWPYDGPYPHFSKFSAKMQLQIKFRRH